ncbi:MAG TPA: polysaccharide biosynthesis tyrosine autokinase [Coriobacteriia bacterium]|nr:polysaccharide biosynthesis tyrosine autokinase [Coriobacteriia bacterium]
MELRDLLNVIRAKKWLILEAVLTVTLVALAISVIQTPTYTGEAKILVLEKDTGAALLGTVLSDFSSQPERGLQTQVQLMRIRPLAEQVVKQLDLQMSPAELLKKVEITAAGQTNVVNITVTDEDPQRAADIANAIATAYVGWSRETRRESIKAAADEVEQRLDEAQNQILTLGKKIEASGKSDQLAAELQIATGTYTTLAERLEQLRVNEQLEVGSGRVVSEAVAATVPVSPKMLTNTVVGLLAGLLLGLGMAYLAEYLDNTIKSTEQAEKIFGAPVLGRIPTERNEKGSGPVLTIVSDSGSLTAEAYRVLRNSLDFVNFQDDIKTVVVTSALPSEGKSTTAANLAAGLATAGKRVVLVACDFRRPAVENFFGVSNSVGLSDVLRGRINLKDALQRANDAGDLLVLAAGKMPPNPAELLGSERMHQVLQQLNEWSDWVIVDSPPVLAVSDPASVARWSDGVLMVVRAGVSTREAGAKAAEQLTRSGARIVGVAVCGVDKVGREWDGYDYARDYAGSYYGVRPAEDIEIVPRAKSADGLPAPRVVEMGSARTRAATYLAKGAALVFGVAAVVAVLVVGTYLLDLYFNWGILSSLLH